MKNMKALLLTGAVMLGAFSAPAMAATTVVDFSLDRNSVSLASGTFSFDSAKTGQLSYSDLDSFSFKLPDNTYDLTFVNSGNFSPYRYFGYNASTQMFVSSNINGFPQILSAIKDDYGSGFFVRNDADYTIFRDYAVGDGVTYTNVSISSVTAAVPEPATWAMMLVGFAMVGAASRYRRRNTNVAYA